METIPRALLFDVFGTVVDMSSVPHGEVREYGRHIRKPEWSPLVLPKSWEMLPAFPDAQEGIGRLNMMGIATLTCANGPAPLLKKIMVNNRIPIGTIVPLEEMQVFKPSPQAYLWACHCANVRPDLCMMVTANVPGLGDLEVAAKLGMIPQAIRQETGPKTIIQLAELLGC
jgi:2-haloacid dehalogenase